MDSTLASGVPGGAALLTFSDALLGTDRVALDAARKALAQELGSAAVARAAGVAANFTKNDRIANACGAPVDPMMLKLTKEVRQQLGLDAFRSAANSLVHSPGA